jgi:hypothetical protein
MPLSIGVLKETFVHEARVALTPDVAAKFVELGASIHMEHGAGEQSHLPDELFKNVQFHAGSAGVLSASTVLLKVQPPLPAEVDALPSGAVIVGFMHAHRELELARRMRDRGITSFAVELIPRISRAQSMDALSSQAAAAGYKAALSAGNKTPAELIAYRATIEALALLSKTFSKLILYPSVVLVILILAHLSIFDNWTIPWPLLVQIALCVFAAIYGNFSLRNEVRKVRVNVLRQLRRRRFAVTQTATGKELQQFDQVMDEIGAERGGAFRPLTEDPLIQAISLPFGGVGGAVLLEEFFRSIG